ncbi:hypothetical protein B0H67DRAFT_680931 [Lasiosphaeris hirsuta]|uniref:Uncharacterized protein n=1 Tax=Lasiosphaeris hirsuta TaxID=260670 RepID=A0AA40B0U6_9PEZI|nr:hypothetical protein B0H67DRAFT_680931 [Lasiosphaeris hirsuta]
MAFARLTAAAILCPRPSHCPQQSPASDYEPRQPERRNGLPWVPSMQTPSRRLPQNLRWPQQVEKQKRIRGLVQEAAAPENRPWGGSGLGWRMRNTVPIQYEDDASAVSEDLDTTSQSPISKPSAETRTPQSCEVPSLPPPSPARAPSPYTTSTKRSSSPVKSPLDLLNNPGKPVQYELLEETAILRKLKKDRCCRQRQTTCFFSFGCPLLRLATAHVYHVTAEDITKSNHLAQV